MDSTTALSYGSPFPDGDLLMSDTSSSPSIFMLSNPPPRSVRNTSASVRGKPSVANAAMTRPAVRPVSALWPAMLLFARSMSRHAYAHLPPTRTYVRPPARWVRGSQPSNSRSRMFASPASSARVLCGLNVLRAYAPACPAVS